MEDMVVVRLQVLLAWSQWNGSKYDMKEDIWDPSKTCIIGTVVRSAGSPLAKRYDTSGNLIEIYDERTRSEIAVVLPAVEPTLVCISAQNNNAQDDALLVSMSPAGAITDYYLSVPAAAQYVEQFNLNAAAVYHSRNLLMRYAQDGQYMGTYYEGGLNLLIEKYGETHEFVALLKKHYADIFSRVGVITKNFGNEAVSIFYNA